MQRSTMSRIALLTIIISVLYLSTCRTILGPPVFLFINEHSSALVYSWIVDAADGTWSAAFVQSAFCLAGLLSLAREDEFPFQGNSRYR